MAQIEQQMPLPVPDLSTIRITTAVSMLGKAYGCGQCTATSSASLLEDETTHVRVIDVTNTLKHGPKINRYVLLKDQVPTSTTSFQSNHKLCSHGAHQWIMYEGRK